VDSVEAGLDWTGFGWTGFGLAGVLDGLDLSFLGVLELQRLNLF
jgi:hypothetical protein